MDELREYLLGIVAAAVLCGILSRLINPKSTVGIAVKLIAGFLLLLAVVSPWADIRLENVLDWADSITADGAYYVSQGEMMAEEKYRAGIKERTEAYIVDEAKALQCSLQAEVSVSADAMPVPESVILTGDASPYARQALIAVLTQSLGIGREDIIWN